MELVVAKRMGVQRSKEEILSLLEEYRKSKVSVKEFVAEFYRFKVPKRPNRNFSQKKLSKNDDSFFRFGLLLFFHQDLINAKRSALIVAASVAGIP